MLKYKIDANVICNDKHLVYNIHYDEDINILAKYDPIERESIIRAILNQPRHTMLYLENNLKQYIIYNCNYSYSDVQVYLNLSLKTDISKDCIITRYFTDTFLYHNSLRCTWITAVTCN